MAGMVKWGATMGFLVACGMHEIMAVDDVNTRKVITDIGVR